MRNMEIFAAEAPRIRIIGVDENAYGPLVGPLLVTGVCLEIEGNPFEELKLANMCFPYRIADSKAVFRRNSSSYSAGEIAAHALLQAFGVKPKTFTELLAGLSDRALEEYKREGLGEILGDVELPLWAKELRDYNFREDLLKIGIEPVSAAIEIVFPPRFNRLLDQLDNKALLDLLIFMEVINRLSRGGEVAFLGKIGGTVKYTEFLKKAGVEIIETLREERGISSYRVYFGEKEVSLHFLMEGDEIYLPIAMASILGKYVRELYMFLLSCAVGKKEKIPWASGYRHDAKTYELLQLVEKKMGRRVREMLTRKR